MKKNGVKPLLVLLGMLVFTVRAHAAFPLSTDDIGTIPAGTYEMEAGYERVSLTGGHESGVGIALKHGITDKMDFIISMPVQFEPEVVNMAGPLEAGGRLRIIEDLFTFTFTNTLGSTECFFNAVFTHEFKPVIVHVNAGYEASGDNGVAGGAVISAAFEYPLNKYDIVGEIIKDDTVGWLLGTRYKLDDKTFVAIGVGNSFETAACKIAFGFHREF